MAILNNPLPADLPTNWVEGQIVSPNGTEVGLTAKHGYNYLSTQINVAQTAINTMDSALDGVAQEATLEDVQDVIGANTDVAGAATVFGQIKQVAQDIQNTDDIIFIPSATVQKTVLNTEIAQSGNNTSALLGYFYAKRNGIVRITSQLKNTGTGGILMYSGHNWYMHNTAGGDPTIYGTWNNANLNMWAAGDDLGNRYTMPLSALQSVANVSSYTEYNNIIAVEKGILYLFAVVGTASASAMSCNYLTVSYTETSADNI